MDDSINSSIVDCAEICKSSASLLMYMTYNIIDYSRIESGEFRDERMPFEIRTLLEKIALISEPHARLKKLRFELEIEDELESYRIMNDERRIIQVLLNLIMNAIKYTFNGKVRLKISQLNVYSKIGTLDLERLYIVFSVVDTGQGISEDKQDNLFKLFGNLNVTDYCQSTSIGLGLAVSKKIVDYMDG
jgi:signal transduction histidine kinase